MNSYIGQSIVSQALFSGPENDLISVISPSIHIFYLDHEGAQVTLFMEPMLEVTNSPSRYYHVFEIPIDLSEGTWLFREVTAEMSESLGTLREELEAILVGPKPAVYILDDLRQELAKKAENFFSYFKES